MSNTTVLESGYLIPTDSVFSLFFKAFLPGLMLPLSFAPFHLPGFAFISLLLLYRQLITSSYHDALLKGFFFGLGYFGFGISWIYVSIHLYGHLNYFLSLTLTFLFIAYLSFFTTALSYFFCRLKKDRISFFNPLLFASLWCLSEILRASLFTGFPWLLLGFGQLNDSLKYLIPILGVYGVSFITCFLSALLAQSIFSTNKKVLYPIIVVLFFLLPLTLRSYHWTTLSKTPLSVGVIQANLSMHDKWDEKLFWRILQRYKTDVESLLGSSLIVLPESAIPLPSRYVSDYLNIFHKKAKQSQSSLLLGIPEPASLDETSYYNTAMTLGLAKGTYRKQHMVPFGEYIPAPFKKIVNKLGVDDPAMLPGREQPPITVGSHTIAMLLCYEVAYGSLLREQLPNAEWIVSLSEDGWFGKSLAIYQHLQIAEVRALQTGRYHIVANNAGLSSVINDQGDIVDTLPAFSAGILNSLVFSATGTTPWIQYGDWPIAILSLIILGYAFFPIAERRKRRYPSPHNTLSL